MGQYPKGLSEKLAGQILEFGKQIARSNPVRAAYALERNAMGTDDKRAILEAWLIVEGFQPRLMTFLKVFDGANVATIVSDLWVFERDVDRGFMGEAVAWGLLFPYSEIENKKFLHRQEVKLKKRLIIELLENLVLAFPELSHELHVEPQYFVYETVLSRARLFPPMISNVLDFLQRKDAGLVLNGYTEALKELESEGSIVFEGNCVRMSAEFVETARNPRTRLMSLSRTVPRALFSSVLGTWSRIAAIPAQRKELAQRLQRVAMLETALEAEIVDPERYIYVPTASGLVPLTDRTNIDTCVKQLFRAEKDEQVSVERIGGILNDVYLARVIVDGEERKVVVKRFKEWSSIKWFPLALWGIGTRNFAVMSLKRLERECSINRLLQSKGFAVPTLLRVSPGERLVFMKYVDGKSVREVVKRLAGSEEPSKVKRDLKIVERVGKRLAKVHALGVALGDTKPENILVGNNSEIILTDFEQASREGDRVWDVAEFLYYAGHDMPPFVDSGMVELIAETFVSGYLEAGGSAEAVKGAAKPKYTKVFSVFTLPHVTLAISNVCRQAQSQRRK